MNDDRELEEQSSGAFSLDAIYYVLFRRKWLILFFLAAAIGGGLTLLFVLKPPQYHSEAELYIRYVVEGRTPTPSGTEAPARMLNEQDDSIINTEIDILRSMDLAQAVVRAVGAERILAKVSGGNSFDAATGVVRENLTIEPLPRRSVLAIFFRHPDPEIAQEVLRKVILAYSDRHIELRHPLELGNFFTQETQRLRKELEQTEQKLKDAKGEAGVASIEDARKEISAIREELFKAQADLAGYQAILSQTTKLTSTNGVTLTNSTVVPPADIRGEYREICGRLEQLQRREAELRVDFLEGSIYVKAVRGEIDKEKKHKQDLETRFPGLANLATPVASLAGQPATTTSDPTAAATQILALESKIAVLSGQMTNLQSQVDKAENMAPIIGDLQRKREDLQGSLKRYSAGMEQYHIEAALGNGSAPNISVIQSPTPARKMWSKKFLKKLGMLVGGCAFFGIALAFGLEFFLDRSVKRPSDIENKLRLPLMISIPDIARNGHRQSSRDRKKSRRRSREREHAPVAEPAGTLAVTVYDRGDSMRRFCEGLRDRLIVDFEVRNLAHNPKLVAVTSCNRGAGVSSIAAGLAASLSESGGGNVLLVDLNDDQGKAQPFHKGKPGRGLDEKLKSDLQGAQTQEGAYAAKREENSRLPSILPRGFANLMPTLKASEYDYIVFDMPPVSQTSMTPRLAGLMDSVLLIVESEKTNQEAVQKANAMLVKSKANVSTVLNKVRTYIPTRLYQEFLNDA